MLAVQWRGTGAAVLTGLRRRQAVLHGPTRGSEPYRTQSPWWQTQPELGTMTLSQASTPHRPVGKHTSSPAAAHSKGESGVALPAPPLMTWALASAGPEWHRGRRGSSEPSDGCTVWWSLGRQVLNKTEPRCRKDCQPADDEKPEGWNWSYLNHSCSR